MADYPLTPEITPEPQPIAPPAYVPKPLPAQADKSPLGPILLGFFLVVLLAGIAGVIYFQVKFNPTPSPTPTSSAIALASVQPSLEPSASPSSTPKASKKPNPADPAKRDDSRAALTPVSQPTLDLRFGNPSANVKQTYDDGSGDGRVINREYTSIQAGQFDEVPSLWSPRVTVCYHVVSNEDMPGKNIKFSFSLDDKIEVEDNLGTYDKLESGRTYDWCHDVTINIGKHTAKLLLNPDKSAKELNYTNDLGRVDWENLPDKIAPNFTLLGPNNENAAGTCLFPQYIADNVNTVSELKIEQKIDAADWSKYDGNRYCFVGTSGTSHTYAIRITDTRGNANEQNKTFVLY